MEPARPGRLGDDRPAHVSRPADSRSTRSWHARSIATCRWDARATASGHPSPQGWAFRDDVHWLDSTPFTAFDLEIRDDHGLLAPARATYYPSHIHYEGTVRQEITASASFTFALDRVDNPLSRPFRPAKRWTCWSSGQRRDWYEIDLGIPRPIAGFDLFFFDDAPTGECRPPRSFQVQFFDGRTGTWSRGRAESSISRAAPGRARTGCGSSRSRRRRFRLVFDHAGDHFYTGLYGVVPIAGDPAATNPRPSPLQFSADKFITSSDTLVSVVRAHNPTDQVQTIFVDPVIAVDDASDSWHVETRWPASVAGEHAPAGHEPRSLSLKFRQDLKGVPVDSAFPLRSRRRSPRSASRFRAAGPAAGLRSGAFAKPRLNSANPDAYKAYGHRIQPGQPRSSRPRSS